MQYNPIVFSWLYMKPRRNPVGSGTVLISSALAGWLLFRGKELVGWPGLALKPDYDGVKPHPQD